MHARKTETPTVESGQGLSGIKEARINVQIDHDGREPDEGVTWTQDSSHDRWLMNWRSFWKSFWIAQSANRHMEELMFAMSHNHPHCAHFSLWLIVFTPCPLHAPLLLPAHGALSFLVWPQVYLWMMSVHILMSWPWALRHISKITSSL